MKTKKLLKVDLDYELYILFMSLLLKSLVVNSILLYKKFKNEENIFFME